MAHFQHNFTYWSVPGYSYSQTANIKGAIPHPSGVWYWTRKCGWLSLV